MTTIMSSNPSPSPSPHQARLPSPGVSQPPLPPLNTNPPPRRSNLQRPPSYARSRMSSYSNTSNTQLGRSRPSTQVFPTFHSSLPYALVRDFAYPIIHPYHYGPPPEPSGMQSGTSTPLSELQRTLSEPHGSFSWASASAQWPGAQWDADRPSLGGPLPQMVYGDGPPYSEDEDLHSPVVTSSRHKKSKSSLPAMHTGHEKRSPKDRDNGDLRYGTMDTYFAGANGRGSDNAGEPQERRQSNKLEPSRFSTSRQRDSHFAAVLPNRAYTQGEDGDSDPSSPEEADMEPEFIDDSRFSRDYQFTIASLDEEMHGKAVALFDFARENENELPLVEGQVILVSYRQQQGWLVAEDPRTGESGLVPEEYVRLLRDIEGGYASLSGMSSEDIEEQNRVPEEEQQQGPEGGPQHQPRTRDSPTSPASTEDVKSPALQPSSNHHLSPTTSPTANTNGAARTMTTTTSSSSSSNHHPSSSTSSNDRRPPVVSSFSTSSSDLNPIPPHLLTGSKSSETPPPVNHYGSQANTPTVGSPPGGSLGWGRKDSGNGGGGNEEGATEGEGLTLGKGAFQQQQQQQQQVEKERRSTEAVPEEG